MKKNEHETLREKFWDWWECTSFGELILTLVGGTGLFVLFCLLMTLLAAGFLSLFSEKDLPAEEPAEGVGRNPAIVRYLSPSEAEEIGTARRMDTYTEGDAPVPEWWNPDEEMVVEWTAPEEPEPGEFGFMAEDGESCRKVEKANNEAGSGDSREFSAEDGQVAEEPRMVITAEPHPPVGINQGGVDWNLCSTSWGWDGHGAEVWEMDLFARVFYLEFWQPDMMLCEAGCDAILRLWESGEKGRTLGEVLSSRNEDGSWTYSVYPDIWTTDYDEDGLAWCRDYTAERFAKGPVWIAPYFRLDYYHNWAVPAYQIGNVYFSVGG